MIFPRCIFPLARETTIHIRARPIKNAICDGRYDFRLAGLVQIIKRNDIDRITISAIKVITLNLRFSIFFNRIQKIALRSKYKISNDVLIWLNLLELGCNQTTFCSLPFIIALFLPCGPLIIALFLPPCPPKGGLIHYLTAYYIVFRLINLLYQQIYFPF